MCLEPAIDVFGQAEGDDPWKPGVLEARVRLLQLLREVLPRRGQLSAPCQFLRARPRLGQIRNVADDRDLEQEERERQQTRVRFVRPDRRGGAAEEEHGNERERQRPSSQPLDAVLVEGGGNRADQITAYASEYCITLPMASSNSALIASTGRKPVAW